MTIIFSIVLLAKFQLSYGTPATPKQFDKQLIDHFGADIRTYSQRYYENSTWWGGPGHPIICIMGGEGAIEPSTGIFYPWVTDVIAKEFRAYVVEPEHRFYGTSLPFGPAISFNEYTMRRFFTPQQAMADTAYFLQHIRESLGCSTPKSENKDFNGSSDCPVITIGGSYPGWLSAMMRLRYPAVVDIAYSASAPMTFYTQEVGQFEYYQLITESAEKSVKDCSNSVREAIKAVHDLGDVGKVITELNICTPLPQYLQGDSPEATQLFFEELDMILMYTFANLNMANNPPQGSSLQTVCQAVVEYVTVGEPIEAIRYILHGYAMGASKISRSSYNPENIRPISFKRYYSNSKRSECFDLATQMPAGKNPTISGGDWSGCGNGRNGQSWDFQTCTFLVEKIGTNGITDMFTPRNWTLDWLNQHCESRFNVNPQPKSLVELWGFDDLVKAGASYILFTNGLNDGWSVGGIKQNLSSTLLTINIADGAHHSDLSHNPPSEHDTEDVRAAREAAMTVLKTWLEEVVTPFNKTYNLSRNNVNLQNQNNFAYFRLHFNLMQNLLKLTLTRSATTETGALPRLYLQIRANFRPLSISKMK